MITIFSHPLHNILKLRSTGKMDLFRTICLVVTGFLLLQVSFPGAAFCVKDGSRVIQCQSLGNMPPAQMADDVSEATCCSRTCEEKNPADTRHQPSSNEADEGSCCISLGSDHDGVICLSFSDSHILAPVTLFDPIEPIVTPNVLLLNRATEKPPSLESLRSVVLIL